MITFDLPGLGGHAPVRGACLGSCRVRAPLFVLRDRGELRIRAEGPTPTHTAAEAFQSLRVIRGEQVIPDLLKPYVYESEPGDSTRRLARDLRAGIDCFILEISDEKQFWLGDICLNQNFVARHLVQRHRGMLLDWYREVSRGNPAKEETIQATLGRLRESGHPDPAGILELLRGVRIERRGVEETKTNVEAMVSANGRNWLLVGLFATDDESDVMNRRRILNASVRHAAESCGALFFDPTAFIAQFGRTRVLGADGANIYEYDESFNSKVGETLIKLLRSLPPRAGLAGARGDDRHSNLSIGRRMMGAEPMIHLESRAANLAKVSKSRLRKAFRWLRSRLLSVNR